MQTWDVQQHQQGPKVKSDDELHSVSEKVKTVAYPKGLAELVVQQNGVIILLAKCSDGIGEKDLYELLKDAGSPQQMIEKFRKLGFTASSRKAYMFARAMLKARLIVVTDGVEAGKLEEMMLTYAPTVEEALEMSFQELGRDAKILGIPQADLLIPVPN